MKFMIPFLIAMLPVASIAQSRSAVALGVPSVAIPKTTEVLVIQSPKQGVTAQQIMAVIPSEIRASVRLYLDGKRRGKNLFLLFKITNVIFREDYAN
jgi:hypothetical protein